MDGKRIQPLTLALCAVLLCVNLWQGTRISQLEQNVWTVQNNLQEDLRQMREQVSSLSSRVTEAGELVQDWELTPVGMDRETRSLVMDASLTLKEWREDTAVWLIARYGTTDAGDAQAVLLENSGQGRFSGTLPIPLEERPAEDPAELFVEARVDSGGLSRQEELGGWSEVSLLLPLQYTGASYTNPEYRNGVFMLYDYQVDLIGPNWEAAAAVEEPVFFAHRNGTEVWRAAGHSLEEEFWANEAITASGVSAAEWQDAQMEAQGGYAFQEQMEIECQPGDRIELFFSCRDAYGLGYTFPLGAWEITGDSEMTETTREGGPVLNWD